MKELIASWLKNKDYTIGIEIYRRYGPNLYLKTMFASGPDTYNIEKLEKELKTLFHLHPPAAAEHRSPDHTQSHTKRPSDANNAPGPIKDAVIKRKSLYARAKANHDRLAELYLENSTDTIINAKLNIEMLNAWDEIKTIWDLTNFYDKNLRLPKPPIHTADYETFDTLPLNKIWLTNYKYIRKYQTDAAKTAQIAERTEANTAIKTILSKTDTFHHEGLEIPTLNT
jgi:hypothetical protein